MCLSGAPGSVKDRYTPHHCVNTILPELFCQAALHNVGFSARLVWSGGYRFEMNKNNYRGKMKTEHNDIFLCYFFLAVDKLGERDSALDRVFRYWSFFRLNSCKWKCACTFILTLPPPNILMLQQRPKWLKIGVDGYIPLLNIFSMHWNDFTNNTYLNIQAILESDAFRVLLDCYIGSHFVEWELWMLYYCNSGFYMVGNYLIYAGHCAVTCTAIGLSICWQLEQLHTALLHITIFLNLYS